MKKRTLFAAAAVIVLMTSASLPACASEITAPAISKADRAQIRQTRLATRDEKIAQAKQTRADRLTARDAKIAQAKQTQAERLAARDAKIEQAKQLRAARISGQE